MKQRASVGRVESRLGRARGAPREIASELDDWFIDTNTLAAVLAAEVDRSIDVATGSPVSHALQSAGSGHQDATVNARVTAAEKYGSAPHLSFSRDPCRAYAPDRDHMAIETDKLHRLIDVGRSLVTELDFEAVLQLILAEAQVATGARYVALGVLNDRRTRARPVPDARVR